MGHIRRLFWQADPEWVRDHVVNGLSSGEGLIQAVRDKTTERKPIKKDGRVIHPDSLSDFLRQHRDCHFVCHNATFDFQVIAQHLTLGGHTSALDLWSRRRGRVPAALHHASGPADPPG